MDEFNYLQFLNDPYELLQAEDLLRGVSNFWFLF